MLKAITAVFLFTSFAANAADECHALFVLRADNVQHVGDAIHLRGVDPNMTWFCDRPVRQAGHMTLPARVELGMTAENSFKENPPNAAVSVFSDDGKVSDAVVTLTDPPQVIDDKVVFAVTRLDGEIPSGKVVLFIDPIGRPMSPTSAAGVHRRHHRRAVRQCADPGHDPDFDPDRCDD